MTEAASRYRSRGLVLSACLILLLGAIVVRLGYLQILRHDYFARLAERQYSKTIPLRPERGPILDRNGYALAVSAPVESVYALPGKIADRAAVAASLAPHLGERPRTSSSAWPATARSSGEGEGSAGRGRRHPGAAAAGHRDRPQALRFYPNRELAAQILGFVGRDDRVSRASSWPTTSPAGRRGWRSSSATPSAAR